MESKCRQAIERYKMISYGDRIILGLSGGADSCALLHFLCSLRDEFALDVTAVHVNHMIRGEEAERDAAFAQRFCNELGVKFLLYKRDIPKTAAEKGIGLEQCGREIRYGIFEELASQCRGKIATAHTLSDSAETVIFHMIRGCSVTGLKGIPPVRGNIIRPLIMCERADIEQYCAANGIDYITDSTNLSTDYARNKIRLQILPVMRELNPSVIEAIGRLSESARSDDALLSSMAEQAAREYVEDGSSDRLISSTLPIMSRALITVCSEKLHIMPEQKHILEMINCISRGKGIVNLPGDHIFSFSQGNISFKKKHQFTESVNICENWQANFITGEIITPCKQKIISRVIDKNKYNELCDNEKNKNDKKIFKNCLDYDKIVNARFRFRNEGDQFRRAGRNGTKSLKKLFIEEKIPAHIRHAIPLLESCGEVAWICGIGAAEQFKVTDTTKRVLHISADLRDITHQGGSLND